MDECVCNEIEKKLFEIKTCFVFNKDNLTHSKPLFENLNPLNENQINIHQHLNFMHKMIDNPVNIQCSHK